jgi:hypothetical protein
MEILLEHQFGSHGKDDLFPPAVWINPLAYHYSTMDVTQFLHPGLGK